MSLARVSTIAAATFAFSFSAASHAAWPNKVFIPYQYLGTGDDFKLTDCDNAIGVKFYTLAFVVAGGDGKPAWDGRRSIDENLYADQIAAIRKRGGDVVCSFGGEAGHEFAMTQTDVVALEATYQSIIDRYKFTWLDFDIEGNNLEKHPEASERRNTAIAALQKKNPGLLISYTLPVDPSGISEASQKLLADAKAKGVAVHSANIMTMYFGKEYVGKGQSEGELSIASAKKAYEQTQAIDPAIQIGLCPCIGTIGGKKEDFTQDDAKTLRAFADKTDWICSLSFWSINRDSGKGEPGHEDTSAGIPQQPWDFANAFKSFTTATK